MPRAILKFLAGLFTNLAAGWIGVAIITPNFRNLTSLDGVLQLIFNVNFAILSSVIAIKLEEKLENG